MHALVCPLCRIALAPTDQVCPRDGYQGREVPWLSVPYALSQRFLALEPFAHGESGSLYIADDPETGRRGLLKVLAPVAKEQHAERQRLRRELVKQATLSRNHLMVPYASGDSEGFTWVFREWLDGVSLEVRLSREGSLQQTEALAIAAQIATALDELHRGGLLHRDVKPGHVFLQHTGHGLPRVQLLDAGIASAIAARGGPPVFGTAGYVAPEQLLGNLVSFRSDLYALGCVLYRMLTGRPAFLGDTDADRLEAQRIGALPPLPPSLPPGIRQLLQSLLAREPQERPFSAQKLRRTLEPFLPDDALIEKQPTTSFELLPQRGAPSAPPSGTLRPPAPQPRSAGASGTMLGFSTHAPRIDDTTHQLDLSHVEEELQARSRPPPAPGVSQPPAAHGPVSEKTQPIRLDQILAVADGRRGASRPPALVESQRDTAPEPEPLPAVVPPSGETRVPDGVGETPESAALFADPSGRSTLRGIVTEPPAASGSPDRSEQTLEVERVQQPMMHAKRTLVGIGASPAAQPYTPDADGAPAGDASSSFAAPLSAAPPSADSFEPDQPADFGASLPAQESPPAVDRDPPQYRQRDIETEPMAVAAERPADRRRMLMYASAALVALAVLGVGVAALLSDDPEPTAGLREAEQSPPPLPIVTEVARVAEPEPEPEPAEEVMRRAPAAASESAPQPGTRRAARAEPAPAATRAEPKPAPVATRAPAREPKPTRQAAAKPGKAPPVKEAAPIKPAAAEQKIEDKAALFAEAREQARVAYASKRYKDAAAAYERAARYDPAHAGTYAGLGAARLQLGDDKGAVQAYQRAVQLSPTTAGFHAALGRAYLSVGDQSRARSAYKQALALDPKNEAAKAALGKL